VPPITHDQKDAGEHRRGHGDGAELHAEGGEQAEVSPEFLLVTQLGQVFGVTERGRVQGGVVGSQFFPGRVYVCGLYGHGYLRCLVTDVMVSDMVIT
jgi:hypothetical protein